MSPHRPRIWRLAALIGLVIGLGAAGPAAAADPFPHCAWWVETTPSSLNVAFPDASAAYWTTPFSTDGLERIVIRGQYVDARYMSLTVYNNTFGTFTCQGTESGLADFKIQPDAGSQNPFLVPASPGGSFTVSLEPLSAPPSTPNVLPMPQATCDPAPSGSTVPTNIGFLVMRVYLPHGGSFDSVPLPSLELDFTDGSSVTLPACTDGLPKIASPGAKTIVEKLLSLRGGDSHDFTPTGASPCDPNTPGDCPPELTFVRASEGTTNSFFPNVDNKYVSAIVQPEPHRLVVIRGKAATVPPGDDPAPWPSATAELRYWSMCSNVYRRPWPVVSIDQGNEDPIVGCVPDFKTTVGLDGFYTYVVSHLKDKPSDDILGHHAATWLPFSQTQPHSRHLMIFRNMLGEDFPHSVQQCQPGKEFADQCATVMGDYYPRAAECRVTTFERLGVAGCFTESGQQP